MKLKNIFLEKDNVLLTNSQVLARTYSWDSEVIIGEEFDLSTNPSIITKQITNILTFLTEDTRNRERKIPNLTFTMHRKLIESLLNQTDECRGIRFTIAIEKITEGVPNFNLIAIPVNKTLDELFVVNNIFDRICTIMTECPPNTGCKPGTLISSTVNEFINN